MEAMRVQYSRSCRSFGGYLLQTSRLLGARLKRTRQGEKKVRQGRNPRLKKRLAGSKKSFPRLKQRPPGLKKSFEVEKKISRVEKSFSHFEAPMACTWRDDSYGINSVNMPHIWATYSDLTRPRLKWWFCKGNPLISENLGWWNITIWPDTYMGPMGHILLHWCK